MTQEIDEQFYERADAHIHLSNEQAQNIGRGKVSASMMYATSRFNAWVSATGFSEKEQMASTRQEIIDYFVEQYRSMLESNLDDYISNFESYMQVGDTHA